MLGSWLPDGFLPTNALHDVAGQHVADGALPMAMACLIKEPIERNVLFHPKGAMGGIPEIANALKLQKAIGHDTDPMNWIETKRIDRKWILETSD